MAIYFLKVCDGDQGCLVLGSNLNNSDLVYLGRGLGKYILKYHLQEILMQLCVDSYWETLT